MQAAIERAIETMWERYAEPLTLTELADSAILSRFYFSRVFRVVTGTSPARFLSAIRLYRAKNLLLETSLTVTEISYLVGYNSLGTFTTRFTRSVGMSPTRFRYLAEIGIEPPVPSASGDGRPGHRGAVHGELHVPEARTGTKVYAATFGSSIPEGLPAACVVVDGKEGEYRLDGVPDGEWCIHAVAVAVEDVDPMPSHRRPLFVHSGAPVRVKGGQSVRVDLALRSIRTVDLPVLLALPELDSHELPTVVPSQRAGSALGAGEPRRPVRSW